MATASELFECRYYPSAVATLTGALEDTPHSVPLLLLRARCYIALRRSPEAQGDLGEVIRLDPRCGLAYRLLGELAARRDENESAAIFFREALRLDPSDQEAADWLLVVEPSRSSSRRPSTRGGFEARRAQVEVPRTASYRSLSAPARLARGTEHPHDVEERPTKPMARGSSRAGHLWTPGPELIEPKAPVDRRAATVMERVARSPNPSYAERTVTIAPPAEVEPPELTMRGRPELVAPAKQAPRIPTRPPVRSALPELPGFGEYLVTEGILTRERLRAAQAYQRSMKVQLATAIVTLGLASPQRIEYASVAHQASTSQR